MQRFKELCLVEQATWRNAASWQIWILSSASTIIMAVLMQRAINSGWSLPIATMVLAATTIVVAIILKYIIATDWSFVAAVVILLIPIFLSLAMRNGVERLNTLAGSNGFYLMLLSTVRSKSNWPIYLCALAMAAASIIAALT